MGLDAVVFRSVCSLEDSFGPGRFDVDLTTGEAILKADSEVAVPRGFCFATKARLGNAAEIGRLRAALVDTPLGRESFLARRVLYSGTHSGDLIALSEFPILRDELQVLKAVGAPGLTVFVDTIESLLKCAEEHCNPVVFV